MNYEEALFLIGKANFMMVWTHLSPAERLSCAICIEQYHKMPINAGEVPFMSLGVMIDAVRCEGDNNLFVKVEKIVRAGLSAYNRGPRK